MLAATLLAPLFLLPAMHDPAAPAAWAALTQERQEAPGAAESRNAMKRLAWLAGQWQGTASITQGPGGAMEVHQSENVRFRVFDTALLIEGIGREKGADGKPGAVIFEALAVVTYDATTKKYAMRAISGHGSVDPRIEVKEKEIIWGFDVPGGAGEVKYHITLDGQGRWVETGEFSRDKGATWMKFIEMTLNRVEAQP